MASATKPRRFHPPITSVTYLLACLLVVAAILPVHGHAQASVTSTNWTVNGDNVRPTPGGHDYIHLFGETVSPSNGSVSYRINYPVPKGRGLNYPYWYGYDSAGLYQLMFLYPSQSLNWLPNPLTYGNIGGFPRVTYQESQVPSMSVQCGQNTYCNSFPCNYATGFSFTGLDGVSHNLGITVFATGQPPPSPPTGPYVCQNGTALPGTDGEVSAQFTDPAASIADVASWTAAGGGIPSGSVGSYTVTDKNGNTYFFGGGVYNTSAQIWVDVAFKVEDRNGNILYWDTDTLGRPVAAGPGSLLIGGIQYPNPTPPSGAPATVPVSYLVPNQKVVSTAYGEGITCPWGIPGSNTGTVTGSQPAWSGIALPDGTQYTFFYGTYNPNDSTILNNYGLINEVKYPGGGWIKYKWTLPPLTNATSMAAFTGTGLQTHSARIGACFLQYSIPVLSSRTVSYDGVTVAQTQTFAYTTTWPANWSSTPADWLTKKTTVTTTDNVLGKTSQIVYNYLPMSSGGTGNALGGSIATQIPVESTIQYFDWGNFSTPVKTVTKNWANQFELACELTTIGGLTSGHFYGYLGGSGFQPTDYLTDDAEFDYGQITNPALCASFTGTAPTPARDTKTTYQAFQVPIAMVPVGQSPPQFGGIFQRPTTTKIFDKTSALVAETDFVYDASGPAPATAVQHDDTNYGTGNSVRGNVTSVTQQCVGSTCTNPVTTYQYDMTGQVVSKTDPCGNGNCSDMSPQSGTNHTATYSYTDSVCTSCSANGAGASNAYLTTATFPQTGSTAHQYTFKYNYPLGDLGLAKDENNQPTTYSYECAQAPCSALDRLTGTAFPDLGGSTITYNDWASVTTSQLITSSLLKTSVSYMDGMFRNIQAKLTSDPDGADITDTTFDGEGRAYAVSNPHRTSASTTDGTTQSITDVLGRPLKITKQDGSVVTTLYADPCFLTANTYGVTVTDEAGNHRRSCTDGLGRLLEVDEPGAGAPPPIPGSANVSVNGGPQTPVTINPCSYPAPPCWQTIYNQGTTSITVNGVTASGGWTGGTSFSVQTLINELVTSLNATGYVSATSITNGIVVTALQGGYGSNYPISTSTTWDTGHFSSPAYSASLSGATSLSGGSGYLFYATSAFITLYNYDALGNLTCVEQHGNASSGTGCSSPPSSDASSAWRVRRFTYDALSRLLTATNPESGTITYAYDVNGNVSSKLAPQPNQAGAASETTSYMYDSLNRLVQKSYSGMATPVTAPVNYGYDGVPVTGCTTTPPALGDSYPKGLRTAMCDSSGATSWAHDQMGRVLQESRKVNTFTRTFTYAYNLDGSMKSLTYPSGHVIAYTPGGAGRPLMATDTTGSINYVSGMHYAPFGAETSMTLGSNPITVTDGYNDRLQPVMLSATTPSATIMSLCYDFHLHIAVSVAPCSFSASSAGDNGNVFQIVNNRDGNRTQNFTYDALNRIATAYTSGPNWGETYTIDAWSNLTNRGPVSGKAGYEGLNCPAGLSNRLTACGLSYDAAGNLTNNNGAAFSYDAENRIAFAGGGTYLYDGDGTRVARVFSSSGTNYWPDLGGTTLLEGSNSGADLREYIYFNGQRVARRDVQTNTVYYMFANHLGSTSLVTNANGTMSACNGTTSGQFESDYYPYGGEISVCNNLSNQNYKFTGKERDAETGLDNFGKRYNASSLGRFMTPDPLLNSGRPSSPKTWNRYSYALNNPLSIKDPDGLYNVNCGNDDSCKDAAKRLKEGLKRLQGRVDKMKDGDQKTRLQHALGALGTENDGNNVHVSFGSIAGAAAATTDPHFDGKTGSYSGFDVKFDMSKAGNGDQNGMAINGAHEGTHVGDFKDPRSQFPSTAMDGFQYEYRGYQASAWAAQALGVPNLSYGNNMIWNSSWAAADRQTLMDRGITGEVTGPPYNYSENPIHDPWPDRIPAPTPRFE